MVSYRTLRNPLLQILFCLMAGSEGARYLGCFNERLSERLFQGDLQNFTETNSQEVCWEHCRSKGFPFAGVQMGRECLCGTEEPGHEWLAQTEAQCDMPCPGDQTERCGGDHKMGVFALDDHDPDYVGCYYPGALKVPQHQTDLLTTQVCKRLCELGLYRYFGTAAGSQCFCGNEILTGGISEDECKLPCDGDKREHCGGTFMQIRVFKAVVREPEKAKWLGCYKERSTENRLMQGDFQDFPQTNSRDFCLAHCRAGGFSYAGLQAGRECYCSNEKPGLEWLVDGGCNMGCTGMPDKSCGGQMKLSVYRLEGDVPHHRSRRSVSSSDMVGCYALSAMQTEIKLAELSPAACSAACAEQGYYMFGVGAGGGCHCSNDVYEPRPKHHNTWPDGWCPIPCPHQPELTCGSEDKVTVYKTPAAPADFSPNPETPIDPNAKSSLEKISSSSSSSVSSSEKIDKNMPKDSAFQVAVEEPAKLMGCYNDSMADLFSEKAVLISDNSILACLAVCGREKFKYAGMKREKCLCGSKAPKYDYHTGVYECDWRCPGEPSDICGGDGTTLVYRIKHLNYMYYL